MKMIILLLLALIIVAFIDFTAPRSNNINGAAISTPTNQIQPEIVGTFRETFSLLPPQIEVMRFKPAPADKLPKWHLYNRAQRAVISAQWQPG